MKILTTVLTAAALMQPAAPAVANPLVGVVDGAQDLRAAVFPAPVLAGRVSVIMDLGGLTVLIDPAGPQGQYRPYGRPDIVVLTSADPDHLSVETMIGLLRRDTVVLAPRSVIASLPLMISNNVLTPFEVGTLQTVKGITFGALDPSDGAPSGMTVFERPRGDIGVAIEFGGARAYF